MIVVANCFEKNVVRVTLRSGGPCWFVQWSTDLLNNYCLSMTHNGTKPLASYYNNAKHSILHLL